MCLQEDYEKFCKMIDTDELTGRQTVRQYGIIYVSCEYYLFTFDY